MGGLCAGSPMKPVPVTLKIVIGKTYLALMQNVSCEMRKDPEWRMQGFCQPFGKIGFSQVLQKGDATSLVTIVAVKQGNQS